MTHLSLEILSAYLDRELIAAKTGEVEEHLAGCSKCQTRLHGLRRVVLAADGGTGAARSG